MREPRLRVWPKNIKAGTKCQLIYQNLAPWKSSAYIPIHRIFYYVIGKGWDLICLMDLANFGLFSHSKYVLTSTVWKWTK